MLNLRRTIVEEFWKNRDARMGRILMWMESMEPWILDEHEDVSKSLNHIMPKIERAKADQLLAHRDDLLSIMAYVSSPRVMRLMEWFESTYSGDMVMQMVEWAREHPENPRAQLMLDRLQALNSLRLLNNVFSPQRTRLVAALLRQARGPGSEEATR
jgi:hypothetical protein